MVPCYLWWRVAECVFISVCVCVCTVCVHIHKACPQSAICGGGGGGGGVLMHKKING